MDNKNKTSTAYKTIGEVAKDLNLIDQKTGNPKTYVIRYWEKQFKQIRPRIRAGGRRYYSNKDLKIIEHIRYLLKDKGLTINGVKKILNHKDASSIDGELELGVYRPSLKSTNLIKDRVKNISKIIKEIKNLKNG